jgi:hypothetical protein
MRSGALGGREVTEVGDQLDALIARNRLLAELADCTDLEDAQSLWRAAKRYNDRYKLERIGRLEIEADPLPARVQGALGGARELMAE